MESNKGEVLTMGTDYFADNLLGKLDAAEPVFAAYEAQDISREVGFDFADFQDVVPRALDEIRETKEAFEEGPEGREHFGDEIADIMFSLINLARHAGIRELTPIEALEQDLAEATEQADTLQLIDAIGEKIKEVALAETENEVDFMGEVNDLYHAGMKDAILLAKMHGFVPSELLKENIRKYLIRCAAIEKLAFEDGKQWADLAANGEIIAYWKRAKTLLK